MTTLQSDLSHTSGPISPGRPLVTFILLAYNQENYIKEAIRGAFSQTYTPLEIIISDDWSSDGTFEIIEQLVSAYTGPHVVRARRNPDNVGLSAHINAVMKIATGEFVTWAAGDDISLPERTELLIQPMLENPNVVATHSSLTEIDECGRLLRKRAHKSKTRYLTLEKVCLLASSVVSQSHAFRRDVFERFGDFGYGLSNEGAVMAFRELSQGSIIYVDKELTLYRITSGVSNYRGNDIGKLKAIEPLKVSDWRRSAFQQMLRDAETLDNELSKKNKKHLRENFIFYTNLHKINSRQSIFISVLTNFRIRPLDTRSFRALIRVMLPEKLYAIFKKTRTLR